MAGIPVEATAFLLLFARVGAVLMVLPVFSEDAIPGRIRMMIAFAMTLGLWGLLSPYVMPFARDTAMLPGIVVVELLTGLGLGMLVRIMFFAMATAGSIISLQIGLTSALLSDSQQGGQAMALSKFVSVAASVVCMALLVHHLWIAAIVRSYTTFPVGGLPAAGDFATLAFATAGRSLALAVSLAAPMIVYGIVFNTALGLSARLAPAIQVFFVMQPLNLVFGIALFATLAGAMMTAFAGSMASWVQAGWG
ncbi:flagellar biosynthetic protein FliR [Sphingomonas mollis]|uniref:Flagellar biosynthetic protein FliR n=1 Tax=Sphingomonas mollis TaxID=2795726 RepID=A0ABS0XPT1_9SPHN|nr:flagellar biosynthetic protein FliR [Sphingomonas sp. BT553]MBJ6122056.1 flagellar biosynthetic protein FliR [Sphingomonas sp. BT553]